MYGLIKTHKVGNPVRVIPSGCGTGIKSLSIFVEKCLYSEVLKIESRVKDTSEMVTVIDNLNKSNTMTSGCSLVLFDIVNIFPSIVNISGLKAVKSILDARQDQYPSTDIEALKLCLECNNSIFNNKHFLQSDSYVMFLYTNCWKRFTDTFFCLAT